MISPTQLEAAVHRTVPNTGNTQNVVDAFRTMSWVRRSDEGTLTFRPEALTVVCAAQHVCVALESQDVLAIGD